MLEILNNLALFADIAEMNGGDFCTGLGPIITLLKNAVRLIQWAIPIGLILFGLLDLGKAVIASKEDEIKKAQGTLIKRCLYAVIVFLIVTIVYFVMGMVGSNDWKECWDGVGGTGSEVSEVE